VRAQDALARSQPAPTIRNPLVLREKRAQNGFFLMFGRSPMAASVICAVRRLKSLRIALFRCIRCCGRNTWEEIHCSRKGEIRWEAI